MATCIFHFVINFILIIVSVFTNPNFVVSSSLNVNESLNFEYFHGDYSPPSPPPPSPPPPQPSLSCETDLRGTGSLDTVCEVNSSSIFINDVYIEGRGSLIILPRVRVSCAVAGCLIVVNVSDEIRLGLDSEVVAGTVYLTAGNVTFEEGSVVNVTGLGGDPPEYTSGSPKGVLGGGGGHGGRGACCVADNSKLPEDVWGGDAYGWSDLTEPYNYGSRGGTTSKEEDYGGEGGGRVWVEVVDVVEVNGWIFADGGDGGVKGGGGSGGSIFLKSRKM